MKGRYLALIGRGGGTRSQIERIAEHAQRRFGFDEFASCGAALICVDPNIPRMVGPASNVVALGALFHRGGAQSPVLEISAALEREIVRTKGGVLVKEFWGAYLAFIAGPNEREIGVLRDPSGAFGCFRADRDGLSFLFSDIEIALRLGLADASVDWDLLARRLVYPIARNERTCLDGVATLLPGELRCFDGARETARSLWEPWNFASPDAQMDDEDAAAEILAAEIDASVKSWARRSGRVLLELSGGLDSSIIAASLANCAADVECVNLYSEAPGGDERRYARAVAQRAGAPLRFVLLDGADADVSRVADIRSPNPDANLLHELIDAALIGALKRAGADAFFSGGGGDNVFCYISTASPAADRLLGGEGLDAFCRTVHDVAALNDCSLWTAGRYAVRKALRARIPWQPRNDLFISSEALRSPPPLHSWLIGPPGALPGKREHVASVAFGLWNADATERSSVAPLRYPLLSQPVAEFCLSVPAWMWVKGGRDRALARKAFRPVLPQMIVNRRTKGDLTGFMTDVFRRQRPLLRQILLDGALAKARIIDRASVEDTLSADKFPCQRECGALLTLAKADVWAQSFTRASTARAGLAPLDHL